QDLNLNELVSIQDFPVVVEYPLVYTLNKRTTGPTGDTGTVNIVTGGELDLPDGVYTAEGRWWLNGVSQSNFGIVLTVVGGTITNVNPDHYNNSTAGMNNGDEVINELFQLK